MSPDSEATSTTLLMCCCRHRPVEEETALFDETVGHLQNILLGKKDLSIVSSIERNVFISMSLNYFRGGFLSGPADILGEALPPF